MLHSHEIQGEGYTSGGSHGPPALPLQAATCYHTSYFEESPLDNVTSSPPSLVDLRVVDINQDIFFLLSISIESFP